MDTEKNATQGLQYSIRTMAQDLERAKKEGLAGSAVAVVKAPSTPPTPPPHPSRIAQGANSLLSLKGEEPIAPSAPSVPATTIPTTPPPIAPQVSLPLPPIEMRRITAFEPTLPPAPPLAPAAPKPPTIPVPEMPKRPGFAAPPIKPSRFGAPQIKLFIIIAAIFIILVGTAGTGYWWFFIRQAPIPQEEPIIKQPKEPKTPVAPQEPSLPSIIITTDQDITIESGKRSPSFDYSSQIASQISLGASNLNDAILARVLIKYVSQTEILYLSLKESLAILEITLPDALLQNIGDGELLAFKKNNESRYGFAARVNNPSAVQNAIDEWVKTTAIFYDTSPFYTFYTDKSPERPKEIKFNDETKEKFAIKYINLPDSSLTLSLALSQEDKLLILATSQDMLYRAISIKTTEIKPSAPTELYPSGTLVKTKSSPKIYRIIDDKKLFIPTKSAFSNSGYKVSDVVTITADILAQFEHVKYFKTADDNKVYEIKYDGTTNKYSKCLITDTALIALSEIKVATNAEFIKYPLGKCE